MSKTRPQIEPTVFRYASMADLPTLDEIVRLAETKDWLIFEIAINETVDADGNRHDPTRAEREQLVQNISASFPSHDISRGNTLYDAASLPAARENAPGSVLSGWAGFSIRRSVLSQTIEANTLLFLTAAAQYEAIVNLLMERLAWQLAADVSSFSADEGWSPHSQRGILQARSTRSTADAWNYFFHGVDCGFGSAATGIHVEARLGYGKACGNNFGVLAPGFFLGFVNSAPDFAPLADLLRDNANDVWRFFTALEQKGLMRHVASVHGTSDGWVLTEAGDHWISDAQAESKTADV